MQRFFNPSNIQNEIGNHLQNGDKLKIKISRPIKRQNGVFEYKTLALIGTNTYLTKYIFPYRWEDNKRLGKPFLVAYEYYPDPTDTKIYKVPLSVYPHLKHFRHLIKKRIATKVSNIKKTRGKKKKTVRFSGIST